MATFIQGDGEPLTQPSPNYPQEIQSVGDKTINLLPYPYEETTKEGQGIKWTDNGDGSITVEGTAPGYSMFIHNKLKLKLQAGKKYRLLAQGTFEGVTPIFAYYNANGVRQYNGGGLEWSDDYSNPDLYLQVNPNDIASGTIYVYLVEESNKNLPYEPYGYKVPVKVSGKNLLNWGTKEFTTTYYETFKKSIPAGTYTFSAFVTSEDTEYDRNRFIVFMEDGSQFGGFLYRDKRDYYTFTANSPIKQINLYSSSSSSASKGDKAIFKDIQIEKGNVATAYEPYIEPAITTIYLTQPLRKIGDYADYIDYKNKKVVRHIVEYKTTGNESYSIGAVNNDTVRFYCQAFNYTGFGTMGNSGKENIVSNKFITSSNNNVESVKCTGVIKDETSGLFNIEVLKSRIGYLDTDTSQEGVSKLKSWLQLNNITLQWVKNEYSQSIEETINIPQLETFKGTTIFDSETTIKPSEIKVDYWKQIGVEDIAEEIVQNGSNILIVSTGAEIVQNESNLIIGG